MGCFHPLNAIRSHHRKENGKYSVQVIKKEASTPIDGVPIQIPCGQCAGCRLERSRQWAIRCVHEASLHEQNSFITLTYSDENIPQDRGLVIEHFQKFMKRLRKYYAPRRIRFFHCGEYGENFGRPHYHACLFNLDFDDKELFKEVNGVKVYTSETLSKIWGKGFVTVGDVNFESAAYVARYIMKKVTGEKAIDHYAEYDPYTGEVFSYRKPEYTTMSRRPGIASGWFQQFKDDVYPEDFVVIKGRKMRPPKFYDSLYEHDSLLFIENLETELARDYARHACKYKELKKKRSDDAFENQDDNTADRLAVKEKICHSRLKQLPRNLE